MHFNPYSPAMLNRKVLSDFCFSHLIHLQVHYAYIVVLMNYMYHHHRRRSRHTQFSSPILIIVRRTYFKRNSAI